jgi:putative flippase GtrA
VISALARRLHAARAELARFGTVGVLSLVVDLAVFNLLRLTLLEDKPITAKVISGCVAALNAFALNRQWSFKERNRERRVHHELVLFFLINGVGLAISLLCLFVSHYLLGFENKIADNIAANGVGLAFGSAFRFWGYRKFIWSARVVEDVPV